MGKKGYIILGVVFLLVLITVISSIIWYTGEIKPVDKNGSSNYKVVEIKSGTSTREIIKILKDNDVIKSELATKVYIKLHEVRNLQAGKYKFNQAMSLEEILAEYKRFIEILKIKKVDDFNVYLKNAILKRKYQNKSTSHFEKEIEIINMFLKLNFTKIKTYLEENFPNFKDIFSYRFHRLSGIQLKKSLLAMLCQTP